MGASGATALILSVACSENSISETVTQINDNDFTMWNVCEFGYTVSDPSMRTGLRIFAYIIMSLSLIYAIFMAAVFKRIRLGLVMHKVASQFLVKNLRAYIFVFGLAAFAGCFMAG
jgi:hypothetical protein